MFYYRIKKTTAAIPRLTSTHYCQFGGQRNAGDYIGGIVGAGQYSKIEVEKISQKEYNRGMGQR